MPDRVKQELPTSTSCTSQEEHLRQDECQYRSTACRRYRSEMSSPHPAHWCGEGGGPPIVLPGRLCLLSPSLLRTVFWLTMRGVPPFLVDPDMAPCRRLVKATFGGPLFGGLPGACRASIRRCLLYFSLTLTSWTANLELLIHNMKLYTVQLHFTYEIG